MKLYTRTASTPVISPFQVEPFIILMLNYDTKASKEASFSTTAQHQIQFFKCHYCFLTMSWTFPSTAKFVQKNTSPDAILSRLALTVKETI